MKGGKRINAGRGIEKVVIRPGQRFRIGSMVYVVTDVYGLIKDWTIEAQSDDGVRIVIKSG